MSISSIELTLPSVDDEGLEPILAGKDNYFQRLCWAWTIGGRCEFLKSLPRFADESVKKMNHECEEIKELLPLHAAGKLSEEQKKKLNGHVLFCAECMYRMILSPDLIRS